MTVGRRMVRSGVTLPLRRIYAGPRNEWDIGDVRGK
jgi:hypothetical protein